MFGECLWLVLLIKLIVKQVLMRLIGADETIYSNFADTLHWLENTDVLEMIVDKFSSSVSTLDHSVT
jgi:hypothetical protein